MRKLILSCLVAMVLMLSVCVMISDGYGSLTDLSSDSLETGVSAKIRATDQIMPYLNGKQAFASQAMQRLGYDRYVPNMETMRTSNDDRIVFPDTIPSKNVVWEKDMRIAVQEEMLDRDDLRNFLTELTDDPETVTIPRGIGNQVDGHGDAQ